MPTSRYASLATRPITEGDYAGPDVRYSSEFEEIEAALEQDGSIHSNGGPDWQQIVAQSEQLLNSQSKDLRVGCWLGWGLYRCDGISGLEAGVACKPAGRPQRSTTNPAATVTPLVSSHVRAHLFHTSRSNSHCPFPSIRPVVMSAS